jgi:Uma2 family endonuclease
MGFASRTDFFSWVREQPKGRFELVQGQVVAMSPERWERARLKAAILRAFEDAVEGRSDCQAVPDGMTVAVDDDTDFEPDVAIHHGAPIPAEPVIIPNPVVVVEVLSPSSKRIDTSVKLEAYFRVASIAHYLVFRADRQGVAHWRRASGVPETPTGLLRLDPPGIVLDLDGIYRRAGRS